MNIALIHYHLEPGGVTTVLNQQLQALRETCDVLVLTGALPAMPLSCDIVQIPGLGYDRTDQKALNPEEVAASILKAIHAKWENGCDLVHVHNPTLAKNRNFLKILRSLQQRKIKLFLQIHDFAEDGRPSAFFSEDEYLADCHYGVINSRDYNILLKAGLHKQGLHKIFNCIRPFNVNLNDVVTSNRVLYPIRAIRRKNIGEAILLSLFLKHDETLAITLPPKSAYDKKSHAGWKTFVKKEGLNVAFDIGRTHEFSELVRSSKFLITTSITEGFGFLFLEPGTACKIVWGRKLDDICRDFEIKGVRLDHLYEQVRIPVEWLDKDKLRGDWCSCVRNAGITFNYSISEKNILDAFEKITANNTIDFGLLNESFQKTIISRVLSDSKNRSILIDLNPFMANPGRISDPPNLIRRNRQAVMQHYDPKKYGENLLQIYHRVIRDTVRQKIDKAVLFSEFLNLERFSLLKWGEHVE